MRSTRIFGEQLLQAILATIVWGPNYPRLLQVKTKYDPTGLFFSTTVWVTKNGVRMALPARRGAAQVRCRRKSQQSAIPLVACQSALNGGLCQVVIENLQSLTL